MTQQEMLNILLRNIEELEARQNSYNDIILLYTNSQSKIAMGICDDPRQEASDNIRAVMGLIDVLMFDNPLKEKP